jgi:hypothetical protein
MRRSGNCRSVACEGIAELHLLILRCPERSDGPRRTADLDAGRLPYGHFTTGGMEERIESTLPPVFSPKIVPRS